MIRSKKRWWSLRLVLGTWGSLYCLPRFRVCLKFSETKTKQLLQFAVHASSHHTFNQSKSGERRQSVYVRGWWLSTPAKHRIAWGPYKNRHRGLFPERGCQKPRGATCVCTATAAPSTLRISDHWQKGRWERFPFPEIALWPVGGGGL